MVQNNVLKGTVPRIIVTIFRGIEAVETNGEMKLKVYSSMKKNVTIYKD